MFESPARTVTVCQRERLLTVRAGGSGRGPISGGSGGTVVKALDISQGRIKIVERRVDSCPTASCGQFQLRPGKPFPFGATLVPGGVNFSVFSKHATSCSLVLFEKGAALPMAEIQFPEEFRIGNVWSMVVFDLDCEAIEYGYRLDGPWDPQAGHRFDRTKILLDPYAKAIGGREVWGEQPDWNREFQHRGRFIFEDFDWEGDRPLEIPMQDLVIYEMHVRGFTRHSSSGAIYPGTFAAIQQKIPYLKELGVNCVELMPIYEFDEFENKRHNPETGEFLYNYWGYSTVGFFAPKAGYAASGKLGLQVDELKNLIKELHKNGIEVILDVVFNHTCEGNENGPTISLRGIDNRTYYMLMPDGSYFNFSGCGNTLNCNNPNVRNLVVDCLRYWASEYHIDGFRFDLAAILGRDSQGAPLANPPLLESLAYDPALASCKLIAEAWDAGGLYQVGSFPAYGRWAEWNGKYRDELRRFLKGDPAMAGSVVQRLQGSPDLYVDDGRGPSASVNFITCHDGFTLYDLFAYEKKHNEANGESNRDGCDYNFSWNCGCEGETADPQINALRCRMMKNAWAVLLVSQGVPMIYMGDEMGRTQQGNNNAYCQDNELSWVDWRLLEKNSNLFRFARGMIRFRAEHPILRTREYLCNGKGQTYPPISWHGTRAWSPDWSETSRSLAFMLCGKKGEAPHCSDDLIYVAINCYWEELEFELPAPLKSMRWHMAVNTGLPEPRDIFESGREPELSDQSRIFVEPRSVVILAGR